MSLRCSIFVFASVLFSLLSCYGFSQENVGNIGTQTLNPDLSVTLDGVGGFWQHKPVSLAGDDPDFGGDSQTRGSGFTIQEAELAFTSNVDPYLKGDLFLTIPNQGKLEIEEGYVITTSLPYDFQIKAGKFRSMIGRQNGQHLHVQDFTRRPLINQNFLGVDGLSAPGVQISWLTPLPFYSTIYVEALSMGPTDDPAAPVQTFGGGDKGDLTGTLLWKNFFPLTEDYSIYFGLNYAQGRSSTVPDSITNIRPLGSNLRSKLYGADMYVKYKPANYSKGFHSLAWQTEFFGRSLEGNNLVATQNDGGIYSQLVYQLSQRWFLGLRADFLGLPSSLFVKNEQRYSSSLTFAPTEFSRLRFYVENDMVAANDYPNISPASSFAAFLQLEISMGAHGAHPF